MRQPSATHLVISEGVESRGVPMPSPSVANTSAATVTTGKVVGSYTSSPDPSEISQQAI